MNNRPGSRVIFRAVRAVRAVVASRLVRRLARIDSPAMEEIETVLALILGLDRRPTSRA